MNPTLFLLLVPPILVVGVMKYAFHATITWKEMGIQLLASLLLVSAVWGISKYAALGDVEIINGYVSGKEQQWTFCEHSYSCNCRTVTRGSGKDTYTETICDTCYEHSNDYDWVVKTTVGNIYINRVDRQGVMEPKRWSVAQKGQPVALPHGYINYVRAAPDSLFNVDRTIDYKGRIPSYPQVYDYHYIDRVIPVDVNIPDLRQWNHTLSMKLNELGSKKQANIVLVISNADTSFADALRVKWLGGKKNDVIVVVGADYPTIKWVQVFSWAKSDIINVSLRNDLIDSKTLDKDNTIDIIAKNVDEHYVRRPMADFKYLAQEANPPMWAMILAVIIGLGSSIGLGYVFHRNDIFPNYSYY